MFVVKFNIGFHGVGYTTLISWKKIQSWIILNLKSTNYGSLS